MHISACHPLIFFQKWHNRIKSLLKSEFMEEFQGVGKEVLWHRLLKLFILVLLNHFLWCLICNSLWLRIPFNLVKKMHFICLLRLITSKKRLLNTPENLVFFELHTLLYFATIVKEKAKSQLISEWNFDIFKAPKKPTKFLIYFCPSFIVQKSV